jgi:hypothetical protein
MRDPALIDPALIIDGFPVADWLRSGAMTEDSARFVLETRAQGQPTSRRTEGWLRLARLGPEYARRIWTTVASDWEAFAQDLTDRLTDGRLLEPKVRAEIEAWHRETLDAVAELQRLAEGPQGEPRAPGV